MHTTRWSHQCRFQTHLPSDTVYRKTCAKMSTWSQLYLHLQMLESEAWSIKKKQAGCGFYHLPNLNKSSKASCSLVGTCPRCLCISRWSLFHNLWLAFGDLQIFWFWMLCTHLLFLLLGSTSPSSFLFRSWFLYISTDYLQNLQVVIFALQKLPLLLSLHSSLVPLAVSPGGAGYTVPPERWRLCNAQTVHKLQPLDCLRSCFSWRWLFLQINSSSCYFPPLQSE